MVEIDCATLLILIEFGSNFYSLALYYFNKLSRRFSVVSESDTYTSRRAAHLSGLTVHMVNYLCRAGVVEPTGKADRGRGKRRAYTFGDVVMLRALQRLLDSGVSVARLKKGLEQLRDRHPEITPNTVPSKFLVSDGKHVYFREEPEVLEALDGKGQFSFALIIEFEQVKDHVAKAIEAGRMQG